ncbi:molybdopterin-dependent oxidoreductase [Streptomyces sp. NPDC005438]|uniref:molybdopterin-dependent oxidoreductase n=1 Tax=Streptomyces sp. NPDC005438 TaxID=3156880 RepID=UPI0033BE85A1
MRYVTQRRNTDSPAGRGARLAHGLLRASVGLVAGAVALAVAELVSAAFRAEASPVNAVGAAVIDRTPAPVKDFAVRTFGSQDKLVLQLGIVVVLAALAMALGWWARRRRTAASLGVLALGAVGALAAGERPAAQATDVLPSLAGAVAGALTLWWLAPGLGRTAPGLGAERADRRRFLWIVGGTGAAAVGGFWAGRRLLGLGGAEAARAREAIRLPAPASRAAPVPRGADLGVEGVSRFLTRSRDFYRVDTALVVPRIEPDGWRLRLHGTGVREPVTLTYQDLLRRDLIERDITLTCVSNQVGGPYVGNARWLGVPLADLLRQVGVRPPSRGGEADQLVARSEDGMTLGTPVETVMDGRDAMLAVGMNGRPLPFTHGFPVRMVVPGLYGYVSACKWLRELELTTFDAYDVYWVRRGWGRRAPVKTQSRIDTPKPLAELSPGTVRVAGVAWAQHRGVERVEVRVDGGRWHRADLAEEDSVDTWRQWVWEWPATRGSHRLEVRATDRSGDTQTARRVGTVPDGATGRHSVVVDVT